MNEHESTQNPDQADTEQIEHRSAIEAHKRQLLQRITEMSEEQHSDLFAEIARVRMLAQTRPGSLDPSMMIAAADCADALLKITGKIVQIDPMQGTAQIVDFATSQD